MISHTDAFKVYRDLGQAHLNFIVLTCNAVPALQAELTMTGSTSKIAPDHFKAGSNASAELLGYAANYQEELARSALITVFSYFEAYVKDALIEVVAFHGGDAELRKMARTRAQKFFGTVSKNVDDSRKKLRDRPDSRKREKYEKHVMILEKAGYRFPTDLLAHFGAAQLLRKVGKRGLKAFEIPDLLEDALLFPLAPGERTTFEDIRAARNGIAHGKGSKLTLKKALRYSSELHRLAASVDAHIVRHFLVIQPT
jgi:hypothetical protein